MQAVSQAWVDAQQQTLLPESFVEISYAVGDPVAQENASVFVLGGGQTTYSDAEETVLLQGTPEKWATLEYNQWILDSNEQYIIIPNDVSDKRKGFVSGYMAGGTGLFTPNNPLLEARFNLAVNPEPIPGITIDWGSAYGECARSFTVSAIYFDVSTNESHEVATTTVTDNSDVSCFVDIPLIPPYFSRIQIEVLKWSVPYRHARINQIMLGTTVIFGKDKIISYEHEMSCSRYTAELPQNKIRFTIDNSDRFWDLENPSGGARYLANKSLVTVRYGYKINGEIEWIPGGQFYLSGWSSPGYGDDASFEASGITTLMTDLYSGVSEGCPDDFMEAAFSQANLPLNNDGSQKWPSGWDLVWGSWPFKTADLSKKTIAEVVQMACNAIGAEFRETRDGNLYVTNYTGPYQDEDINYEINPTNAYSMRVYLKDKIKRVDVNGHEGLTNYEERGTIINVDNPLGYDGLYSDIGIGEVVNKCINKSSYLDVSFRADPRLDAGDIIYTSTGYNTYMSEVCRIKYTYNGVFKASAECMRWMSEW